MASRESRRYKRRGVSISFGDIMLPFVGIVAIGLLVVAGKLFFLNGIRPERSPLPVVREFPDQGPGPARAAVPSREQGGVPSPAPNAIPEGTGTTLTSASVPSVVSTDEPFDGKLPGQHRTTIAIDVLAIPYGTETSDAPKTGGSTSSSSKETPKKDVSKESSNIKKETPNGGSGGSQKAVRRVEVVVSPTRKTAVPQPSGSPAPDKRKPPAPVVPNPVPRPRPRNSSWHVQVGAFSTKESAVEISRKLSQSGYKVSVSSGVRFHRVVVQAGSSRQEALTLASRLQKEGFPDVFSIPPASP